MKNLKRLVQYIQFSTRKDALMLQLVKKIYLRDKFLKGETTC